MQENILDKIVADKKLEVRDAKALSSLKDLESSPLFGRPVFSLCKRLSDVEDLGIIAEIKRKSPSKGIFNLDLDVKELADGYLKAGATALSILTDYKYFGGSNTDIVVVRDAVMAPVLRKEFVIDEFQIVEAKSVGADVILLIARILTVEQSAQFAKTAKSLGLEVLLEIHEEAELEHLNPNIDIVGVNNRNLDTLAMDLNLSEDLFSKISSDFIRISESGISNPETIKKFKDIGYDGFLIGENFMKTQSPEIACAEFIKLCKR